METSFFIQPITPIAMMLAAMAGLLGGTLAPAIVWNRLGLLGDTISHASLSIMAVGLLLGFADQTLLIPFAIVLALLLSFFDTGKFGELDSVLAVLFSGLMGLGMLLLSLTNKNPAQILTLLTGDISQAGSDELIAISIWTAIVLSYLLKFRTPLRLIMTQPDLAKIQGHPVRLHKTALLVLVCLSVALCIKMMGVILVTTLFVTPALISGLFAKSAGTHATLSMALGLFIALTGILVADQFALSPAPLIATFALILFFMTWSIRFVSRRN